MSTDRRNKNKQDQDWKEEVISEEVVPEFRWEYAFESLTEVGSVFRKNHPEYERDSYSWRQ